MLKRIFVGFLLISFLSTISFSEMAFAASKRRTIAGEGQSFFLSKAKLVRYGTPTRYISKSVKGTGVCNNRYFGGDPAPFQHKECSVSKSSKKKKKSGGGGGGGGSSSSKKKPTPPPVVTLPNAPTNLSGTALSSSSVSLTWSASTSTVSSYKVYRDGVFIASTSTTSYTDSGLSANTLYAYQVTAVDSSNQESTKSSAAGVTTQANITDTEAPTTPTNLTATAVSSSQINLSWSASTDNVAVSSYEIFRDGTSIATVSYPLTTYQNTGLTQNTTYTYTIRAKDAANNASSQTSGVQATTSVATYALNLTISGTGTVTSSPSGINCTSSCSANFNSGTSVTLTATAGTNYTFTGWSGGVCTGTSTCTTTMSQARSVTATFTQNTYTLSVSKSGTGTVTSSPAGINCGATCSASYNAGTSVTLTASAGANYTFTGWSGACTGTGTCTTTMSQARSVTATFTPNTVQYTLSLTIDGTGTVTSSPAGINCTASCTANFDSGTNVTLTATAGASYTFTGWSGACTGTGTCTTTMSAARSVTATFTATTYALTLTISGTGTVTSSPSGINCTSSCSANFNSGTSVTLTATAGTNYTFTGWSGGVCTGTSTCTTTMSAARSVTATFTTSLSGNASYIPLTLASTSTATSIPVKSGIPFPIGALTSLNNIRLENSDGTQEIPAQFNTLSQWPDGSMKSVLVQFVTDVGSQKSYRIAYGSQVTRSAVAQSVSVTQNAGSTTVDTGSIKYTIDTKGLIASLYRDSDHDGSYATGEQVLGSEEFFMVNAFNSQEYKASLGGTATITLEEQGPIRSVIRAAGSLKNSGGTTLMKYLVRYYAYAGSDKLDMDFTVIDDRAEANVESPGTTLALAAKSYGIRFGYISDSAASYRFGLENGTAASGTVSGEQYLLQTGVFTYKNGDNLGNTFSYSGAGTGSKAPGWVALDQGSRHLSLMVRDFWQQYPAELNVQSGTLTAELFAARSLGATAASTTLPTQSGTTYKRPNDFYFLRPGGAKTHQLRFAFGDVTPSTTALVDLNTGYQRHRLELYAAPSWYASSKVFGDIDTGNPNTSTGYSAMLMQDIYVPSVENNPNGETNMYGWRDYGDRLRVGWNDIVNGVRIPAFYNDTHIGANMFLHEFVRTGDQRWFGLGEIATHHFEDIDVAHGPRNGYWDQAYDGMGQQPAGEIHASSHNNEDHQQRNMHWGHAHVSGLSDLYLLTGDKRAFEVLTEIANWWQFVTPYFYELPFSNSRDYREAERDFAWPLYVMNEYVRVTGDSNYHKNVSAHLVNYLIQWWQTPLNHIGYNPATGQITNNVINVNNAANGTGYWTMSLMDNNDGTQATGTNPWMAGPLLSAVITFYEQDKLMSAAGKGAGISYVTIEDMLMQCMNYVVKYGWSSSLGDFVYSEVIRQYNGHHQLIDYPLAYLNRLYNQRVATGSLAHPEWYDTHASWATISSGFYNWFQTTAVGSNTQSWGFYGYEFVTPVDFFKIMSGQ